MCCDKKRDCTKAWKLVQHEMDDSRTTWWCRCCGALLEVRLSPEGRMSRRFFSHAGMKQIRRS